jgi:hypothetical protein
VKANRWSKRIALAVFVAASAVMMMGGQCDPFIDVKDDGGTWEKAGIDKQLKGTWYLDLAPDLPMEIRFRAKDDLLILSMMKEEDGKREDADFYRTKTLKAGKHTFLVLKPTLADIEKIKKEGNAINEEECSIWRYTVENGVLRFYELKDEALRKAAKDPRWKDLIGIRKSPGVFSGESSYAVLNQLNANALKLLEELAGDPENWAKAEGDDDIDWVFTRNKAVHVVDEAETKP